MRTISVRPAEVGRVIAQKALPQTVGRWRDIHRHARMAGWGFLDRVDGKRAQGVDANLIEAWLIFHA